MAVQLGLRALHGDDVRQADAQHGHGQPLLAQGLQHGTSGATHQGMILDGHQLRVTGRGLAQGLAVDGLDEAHVDHAGIQRFGGLHRLVQQGAEGEDGDALAASAPDGLADGQGLGSPADHRAAAGAARVAHGGRAFMRKPGVEHAMAFGLVARGHQQHVGHAAQEGEVVQARMGRAVRAHEACAVDGEQHGQVLQGDVVHGLVVAALQEGGVDRHDRLHAGGGQPAREGHGVLLGDADIVIALGEAHGEVHHARSFAHGGGDADHPVVAFGRLAQPVAERAGERAGAFRGRGGFDLVGVEPADAVEAHRVGLGGGVAATLLGDHMQQARAGLFGQVAKHLDQGVEVMAIDRADIAKAELLEQRALGQHALDLLACPVHQLAAGQDIEQLLAAFAHPVVGAAGDQAGEVPVERADVGRDRHGVVVQHHQKVGAACAGMVERLEGLPGGHGAVADDGHGLARQALHPEGLGEAQRGADRGAGVSRAERIVGALVALGETGQAAELAQGGHGLAATREDLVRIGLVADVPDQRVVGKVQYAMQGEGQLDRAKVGGEVAAGG